MTPNNVPSISYMKNDLYKVLWTIETNALKIIINTPLSTFFCYKSIKESTKDNFAHVAFSAVNIQTDIVL